MATQFAPTTAVQLAATPWAAINQQAINNAQGGNISVGSNQVQQQPGSFNPGGLGSSQGLPQLPNSNLPNMGPPGSVNKALGDWANQQVQKVLPSWLGGTTADTTLAPAAAKAAANTAVGVGGADLGAAADAGAAGGVAAGAGSAGGLADMCCWIMTYGNGGYLPWFIRPMRNIAYEQEPAVARGYKRMARWLVPLMHWFPLVDGLVQELMVKPLTEHCGWLMSVKGCRARTGYQRFWFSIWKHTK
jgi:hypothetical protein